MQKFALLLLMTLATTAAQSQVVRCESPKTGQVTYSDHPCDSGQVSKLVERRKSPEEVSAERQQADEANERKYRSGLADVQMQQRARQQAPVASWQGASDKSASHECRQAQKDHETVASIQTGTKDYRRNRLNASTVKVNAACGMSTELMQEPPRRSDRPTNITRCDAGFCFDNLGGVYHRAGPGFMTGPNGRTCHGSGNTWTCN